MYAEALTGTYIEFGKGLWHALRNDNGVRTRHARDVWGWHAHCERGVDRNRHAHGHAHA